MKRASSPFPAEFSGMAYFPLPIPAETSYAECRRFSDSLPGNAVFMANPACPVMKEPIPIQQWLPAGPLRDMGEKYVSQLPDVAQNPIGPESLMHQSNHSWSEYLVAYSLLYPGVVIILWNSLSNFGAMIISVRRFLLLPSAVSLSSTGIYSPRPLGCICKGFTL